MSYFNLRDVNRVTASNSGSGSGTEIDPYIIVNIEQLKGIDKELKAHYKLGANIDLENGYWTPLGSKNPFQGSLDGNGYVIKNLAVKNLSIAAGLFGNSNGAKFKQVKIENVEIESAGNSDVCQDSCR